MSDRTEDPTPRRLRRARAEGDSAVSVHAAQAVAFVAALALVPSTVSMLVDRVGVDLRSAIERVARPPAAPWLDPIDPIAGVVALVLPVVLVAAVCSAAAHVVQTGGVVVLGRITPDLARLNPLEGLARLFSLPRVLGVARSMVGALAVGWLAWTGIARHLGDFAHIAGRPGRLGLVVSEVAGGVAWRASLIGLALGAIDVAVTRRAWWRRLRMNKDEIKREHRESEGDPWVKAARERAYRELIAQATVASVRTASVVVINPTHLACALRYDAQGGDEAPVVLASGEGDLASRIVQAARDWGVPVVQDVPLAHALVELSAGDAIPEALYEAVAEILRDVWAAEGQPSNGAAP